MASVTHDGNGSRRIQFFAADGSRKAIRLGKVTAKQAEFIKLRVEALVSASVVGTPAGDEVARWLAGIDAKLRQRLERAGLVAAQSKTIRKLSELIDAFFEASDTKASTRHAYQQATKSLLAFFGDCHVREIKQADADRWRAHLAKEANARLVGGKDTPIARATLSKRVQIARQMFAKAVRWGAIESNPMAGLRAGSQSNPERLFFVTREMADQVLAACPSLEWKLIFALARYGGLRCPSEHLALKWSDVDWERGRFTVRSPKKAHDGKGGVRVVPLFHEIKEILTKWQDQRIMDRPTDFILTHRRHTNANLRKPFFDILKAAGIKPWPKLFQNLRSTRETELAETFPIHVVCAWIGNSESVARKHYLQVLDTHFEAAQKPAQKAAQQAAALRGNMSTEAEVNSAVSAENTQTQALQEVTAWARQDSKNSVNPPKNRDNKKSGAKSGAPTETDRVEQMARTISAIKNFMRAPKGGAA